MIRLRKANFKTLQTALTAAVLASGLLMGSIAEAYVPPSAYIVKKITGKRGRYKLLRLKSNVRGMSGEKPTGAHFKTVSLFEPKRRLIQTWALDEAGQVLYFEQRDLNRTRMGPRKLGDARLAYMVSSLLLEWDGETMVSATRAQGLPVLLNEELLALPDEEARRTAEQVTLARTGAESTVAWVLGTEDTPRLWVEKDSFLPMKYVDEDWGPGVEVRMENHRYSRDLPFPRLIRLMKEGSESDEIIREEMTEVTVNPSDRTGLPRLSRGFTARGKAADSTTRDLIERYFSSLR